MSAKRRARGTGSIFRVGDRWVGRVRSNGRSREVSGASQADVVRKLARLQPPGPETTVGEWADRWLAGLSVRPTTYQSYECNARNHVKPLLGHVRVNALTPYDCEQAVRQWAAKVRVNSARLILDQLSICLHAAVRAGLRADNPAAVAKRPPRVRLRRQVLSPEDITDLVRRAAADPAARPLALLAAVGCRIGEAVALDVTDFDPDTGDVSISKTWEYVDGVRRAGPPKSANGVRTVRVPAAALAAVRAAHGGRAAGPLFLGPSGGRVNEELVRTRCRHLCGQTPHTLRHSVATALVSAGAPLADVARFIGDTVGTVVRTYLHPSRADVTGVMDRLLGGGRAEVGSRVTGPSSRTTGTGRH